MSVRKCWSNFVVQSPSYNGFGRKELSWTFRDENSGVRCLEYCATEANECKKRCNENSQCLKECDAELIGCTDDCPCQVKCPNGCSDCESIFCQCVSGDEVPGLAECEERDLGVN